MCVPRRSQFVDWKIWVYSACVVLGCSGVPTFALAQEPPLDTAQGRSPAAATEASNRAQPDRLRRDVEYLASETLRGRGVEDDTIDMAADYIADQMVRGGFASDKIDGGPFQSVSINLGPRPGPADANKIEFSADRDDQPFVTATLGEDMNPLAIGSSSASVAGPLAMVGYGISADELRYNDFADIDVRGCVVMMLRKTPGAGDSDSVFDRRTAKRHALFERKIQTAVEAGAAAVLLINDPKSTEEMVQGVRTQRGLEQRRIEQIGEQIVSLPAEAVQTRQRLEEKVRAARDKLQSTEGEIERASRGLIAITGAGNKPPAGGTVAVASISRRVADQILQTAGRRLQRVEESIDTTDDQGYHQPLSFRMPAVRCRVTVSITPSVRASRNVIGVIDGRGPLSRETVIVGAHYDHVGMGGYGSLAPATVAVHNGADDNASGTAVMLEVGRVLARRMERFGNRRKVLLIAFTGEERGLLGSQYFVRHSRVNLASVQTMINLDMVGRLRDNELTVYGTGSGTRLSDIVDSVNGQSSEAGAKRFEISKVPTGYGPSDHQSFYVAGVPVLFFFTGLHNDYHRPSDDVDKLAIDSMGRIADLVADVAERLATMPDRVRLISLDRGPSPVPIRRQLIVRLGISMQPGTTEVTASQDDPLRSVGVIVTAVTPGSTAEAAGLQIGDQITTIGLTKVTTPRELLEALRPFDPGTELSIEWVRDGAPRQGSAALQPRDDLP